MVQPPDPCCVLAGSEGEWMRRPEVGWSNVAEFCPELSDTQLSDRAIRELEIEVQYEGYVRRQEAEIAKLQKVDSVRIPDTFDFAAVTQLRHEAREKLGKISPETLGQASRVSGITPADIAVLVMYLKNSDRSSAV